MHGKSIKHKTKATLLLIFVQGWTKLRNLQKPSFQSSLYSFMFTATGEQKCTEVTKMMSSKKHVDRCSIFKHTTVSNRQNVLFARYMK